MWLVTASACEPNAASVQLFDSTGTFSAIVSPEPGATTQLGRAELGRFVADDVDVIEYRVPTNARIYLLRGDVNASIDTLGAPVDYLRMPSSTDASALRRLDVGLDKNWSSLRVEDMGHCALFLSWEALQFAFNAGVVQALLDSGNFSKPSVAGTGIGRNMGPILRRVSNYESDDQIRYNGRIQAASAGGCAPINVDFATRWTNGVSSNLTAAVEVEGFCVAEAEIEAGIVRALRTSIPAGFQAAVALATHFDPGEVGLPQRACEGGPDPVCPSPLRGSDSTCGGGSNSNVCDVRIDVDRLHVIPEGILIVYAEDTSDPQISIIDDALGDVIFAHLGINRETADNFNLAEIQMRAGSAALSVHQGE